MSVLSQNQKDEIEYILLLLFENDFQFQGCPAVLVCFSSYFTYLALDTFFYCQINPSQSSLLSCHWPLFKLKKKNFIFLVEVQLIHSIMLISAIQQSASVIHNSYLLFFSLTVYHRTLNIVLCAVLQDLVVYPFYM